MTPWGAAPLTVLALLAADARAADAARGEVLFQHCYSCHSIETGETGLEGPNLRGIVGRRIAAQDGFAYSPALQALAERQERWSEALLDRYFEAPYRLVPRTSMSFPGLSDSSERADLVAYLRAIPEGN